jgi:hypothetical protein
MLVKHTSVRVGSIASLCITPMNTTQTQTTIHPTRRATVISARNVWIFTKSSQYSAAESVPLPITVIIAIGGILRRIGRGVSDLMLAEATTPTHGQRHLVG